MGSSGVTARPYNFRTGYSCQGIQSVELRLSWLPSFHYIYEIVRRRGLDETSEMMHGIGRVDRRGKMLDINARDVVASPRCLYTR